MLGHDIDDVVDMLVEDLFHSRRVEKKKHFGKCLAKLCTNICRTIYHKIISSVLTVRKDFIVKTRNKFTATNVKTRSPSKQIPRFFNVQVVAKP